MLAQARTRRLHLALATHLRVADAGQHIAEWIVHRHVPPPLPARLHEARNQALRSEFAQRNARHLHLAREGAGTARDFATVANASRGRVAGQFGELEARVEALLHAQRVVVGDRLQALAAAGVGFRQRHATLVLLNRALLSHELSPLFPRLRTAGASLPEREVE